MDQDEFEVDKNGLKDRGWYPTMLTDYACSVKLVQQRMYNIALLYTFIKSQEWLVCDGYVTELLG